MVVSSKDGSGYKKADTNIHERYNAGTYYFDLKFKENANRSVLFEWANSDRPTFVVEKLAITVQVVPKTDGGSLTHVYGDSSVAAMKYILLDDPADDEDVDDVITGEFIRKDNNTPLGSTTPAGKYEMIGVVDEKGNYDISFKKSVYEVTKRPVTIKIEDEEIGYGTDLSDYTFEFTTEDSLARGETLEKVISSENVKYTLYSNGNEVAFSDSLQIGEYEVRATVTADNYIFTVTAGKLTVTKANFDMSGVTLTNTGYIYDGDPKPAKLNGELPSEEITVSYRYVNYDTGEELDGAPTEVGLYLVYASFSHNNSNYNPITEVKAAYIRIAYTQDELNQPYPPLPTDEQLAAAADLAKKKADAKEELEKEAQAKKEEIDADVNLSAEEKAAAKSEIDKELADGKSEIDKAKDKDGVNSALESGKKEIDDTAELAQKKGAAKSELDKAAQAKKEAIDNNPELTDEEKAAAKAEVDKELEEGKKAIDGANSIDGVQSAESTTKTNIENIKPEHKGSFPWWILAVIAGAIVLVTVIIIVIAKRRGSDDDDGGYDDFYDDEYDYDEEEEVDDDGGEESYGF